MMEHIEARVERLIREATERGEFDDLSGTGKPLDLSGLDDPDWWARRKIAEENLDSSALLPPTLQLRKERDGLRQTISDIRDETQVRAVLEDFNRRVRADRLSPALGPSSYLIVATVDVDDMVAAWREQRR